MKFLIKIGFLFIVTGIFLLTIEHTSALVSDFNSDQSKVLYIENEINSDYEMMNNKIEGYKKILFSCIDSLNLYYEEINNANKSISEDIKSIKKSIVEINIIKNNININCSHNLNGDDLSNKCNIAKNNYENAMNSYTEFIENYNILVENYNKWAIKNKGILLKYYESV